MEPTGRNHPDFVPDAAHAMAVLEAFTPAFAQMGINELAQRAGLPRPVAARIAFTLCELGYLRFDKAARVYRLGPHLIGIARHFLGSRGVRARARGHMEALAARFRAPVALSERDGLDMVYLEYVRGDAPVVVQHRVGTRLPIATSASGRAWLASASPAEARAVQDQLAARMHRDWPALQPGMAAARDDLAAHGFARSYGEMNAEVNAVAVPLQSPLDGLVVVFSLAAPAMLVPSRRFDIELGPALVAMVATIRTELETAGARAPAAG
jgi:DNA-binding IclR family transcriptional regulator